VPALLRQLGVPADAPILVGGSTHDGEEFILAEIAQRLRARFPKLFLVLVPRHFERAREVGRQLRERGVKFVYRNEIFANTQLREGEVDCLLVNTTGELRFFYRNATVVFVGKSLTAIGGQNPIEPGALGKAMVFGPNMQNFADITQVFLKKRADPGEQSGGVGSAPLPNCSPTRPAARNWDATRWVVAENLGAIDRTVEMILEQLKKCEIYIASGINVFAAAIFCGCKKSISPLDEVASLSIFNLLSVMSRKC
jgi:3-deoxy-D-manno-octulosonic-acid transferase